MSSYIPTLDYIFNTQQGTLVDIRIFGRYKQLTYSSVTYSVILSRHVHLFNFAKDNILLLGILFSIQSLLYVRQIHTIHLPKTTPTHEQ